MKGILAVSLVMGLAGSAAAENQGLDLPENPLETPWSSSLRGVKRWVDDDTPRYNGDDVQHAAGFSNIIYMNNCKPNGCQVSPGSDNSLTNTSIIPNQPSVVQPFAASDTIWNQVVQCVRETYAPFAVTIVTERPTSGNYHMAIVAGVPQNVGEPSGVGGVSPFGCGYLPNRISYSFANVYGNAVNALCAVVAQETAHSWGLDHKFDNRDPMTYLNNGPSRKYFQNETGACGEFSARACDCGGNTMNSHAEIAAIFGGSTPTPPMARISVPEDGATGLSSGFLIQAEVSDDVGIDKVEIRIDGTLAFTKEAPPWGWAAPATLAPGTHAIEITAFDIAGTTSKHAIMATIGAPCSDNSMCPAGNVCAGGRCILGNGSIGGLGTECVGNNDCSTGMCAGDGAGTQLCVVSCDTAEACPSGFDCLSNVCWPAAEEGICSVGSSGRRNTAPTFLLLGLAALWITRRRRVQPRTK